MRKGPASLDNIIRTVLTAGTAHRSPNADKPLSGRAARLWLYFNVNRNHNSLWKELVLTLWPALRGRRRFSYSFWCPGQAISHYSTLSGLLTGTALCTFSAFRCNPMTQLWSTTEGPGLAASLVFLGKLWTPVDIAPHPQEMHLCRHFKRSHLHS